ncbi:hypothetical protein DSO57_1017289 [Entomophthora muscae]|uniref:Uncharacterized protein n=1 Tax=Entomophthora muscae TaxID=34485 RepID=A0ACC2UQZ3_9FUNG|nr:hypothetical protein DSO57_1017289 [Entomophthora muscae]
MFKLLLKLEPKLKRLLSKPSPYILFGKKASRCSLSIHGPNIPPVLLVWPVCCLSSIPKPPKPAVTAENVDTYPQVCGLYLGSCPHHDLVHFPQSLGTDFLLCPLGGRQSFSPSATCRGSSPQGPRPLGLQGISGEESHL